MHPIELDARPTKTLEQGPLFQAPVIEDDAQHLMALNF